MFYLLDALFMNYYEERKRGGVGERLGYLVCKKKKIRSICEKFVIFRSINFVDNWKK